MPTVLDENKALVRRFFAAVSYDGDLAALDDLCSPCAGRLVHPRQPRIVRLVDASGGQHTWA